MPEATAPAAPATSATTPVTTPPAQPAATPAAAPPAPAAPAAETSKVDPWMKHMAESIGMALDEDITLKPAAPETAKQNGEPTDIVPRRTLGDMALESSERAKIEKDKGTPPPAAPPAGAPGAPAAPVTAAPAAPAAAPAVASAKPIEIKRPAVDELATRVTKDVMAEVRKLQTPPAAPAAPATPTAEAQWEATLPEENREMLELLRWGEENGMESMKGKAAEQSGYLRRLEEFAKSNPDEDTLNDWVTKNRPALSDRLLRKAAEQRLLKQAREEAAEEIRKENEPRMAEVEARQRAAEVRPIVEQAATEFTDRFTKDGEKTKAGTPRITPAVAKKLREVGVEGATEEFPIEAPVLNRFNTAARALLDLRAGLVAHDPANEVHQWLGNFIFRQEQALLSKPENERIINGKQFLPAQVYYSELSKNPEISKTYTTFNDQNLLDMLEETAHRTVKREYDRMEKAGFVRKTADPVVHSAVDSTKPSQPATTELPAAAATSEDPNAAPRAGASKAPGAAVGADDLNPHLTFLKKIYPDAERALASP